MAAVAGQYHDAALVSALRNGEPAARAELFDRYAAHAQRVLARVLGHDAELADLLHDVFARALTQIDRLEDPSALKAWLTMIAVGLTSLSRARAANILDCWRMDSV